MRLTLMEGFTYDWQLDQEYLCGVFTYGGRTLHALAYTPFPERTFKLVV